MHHTFCVFVRIASPRWFYQIHKTYVFLKNNMGMNINEKNTRSADCCANQTNVITNVVITRVHCTELNNPSLASRRALVKRETRYTDIHLWTQKCTKFDGPLLILILNIFQNILPPRPRINSKRKMVNISLQTTALSNQNTRTSQMSFKNMNQTLNGISA